MSKLAIIGGSGLYKIDDLDIINEHEIDTPFGKPSAPITEGRFENSEPLYFLPRHGAHHSLLPSEVNYRANIYALKKVGATRIVSVSATGSLRKEIKPGDMALVSQYFDHTRGNRETSFFGQGIVGHISTAKLACPALTTDILTAANTANIDLHTDKTYACVEGPRLGTMAESNFLRQINADIVGMTNLPEAFLAREAQMAYCTLAIATDYDCWMEDESAHAQANDIMALYMANIDKVKAIIRSLATTPATKTPDWIRSCLKHSILTPPENITEKQKQWLSILQK